jgi:hypothetical protein
VLRPLPRKDGEKQTHAMVNLAYVAGHKYGHDFVKRSSPGTKWEDFEEFGLQKYTVV